MANNESEGDIAKNVSYKLEFASLEYDKQLARSKATLEYLQNQKARRMIGTEQEYEWIGCPQNNKKSFDKKLAEDELFLFQILEITFEEEAPRKEAMENILGTFRGMEGISFVYMILGDEQGVKFYFGVVKDKSASSSDKKQSKPPFGIPDLGADILMPSMQGNFRGSKIKEVNADEKKAILERLKNLDDSGKPRSVGMVEGVPSVDEESKEFQGSDRLIDVMMGDNFGFVVIAAPYTNAEVDEIEQQLWKISDALNFMARQTKQRVRSWGENNNHSESLAKMTQTGISTQYSKTASETHNHTTNADHRTDKTNQEQSSANQSANEQWSKSKNYSIANAIVDTDGSSSRHERKEDKSGGHGSNMGYSVQNQSVYSCNASATVSDSTSDSINDSAGHSDNRSLSRTKNNSENISDAEVSTQSSSVSITDQMEVEAKSAADWLSYLDKVLLPRLDQGRGKGIFLCCTYLFAEKKTSLYRLANTAISLYSGPKGNKASLFFTDLTDIKEDNSDYGCLYALQNLQIPEASPKLCKKDSSSKGLSNSGGASSCSAGFSRSEKNGFAYCGSWMSANELGLLAGLPQKEVIGLRLREEVEFGLNVNSVPDDDQIKLGYLVQGGEKTKIPVFLNRKDLDKHTFVSGVTGSGKTTTCQNILLNCVESGVPFLVIEPAKTEYRSLLRQEKCSENIIFFTPGRQDVAPFFLNPFELFPGEAITSRADMLKATFEASFAMEAAIPQIMEAAIYRAYEKKGWHIGTNRWRGKNEKDLDGPFSNHTYAFPTLTDYVAAVQEVTKKQGFDTRLENDYLGSINARLEGLMVGAKGQMLNTARSINFADIVTQNVVIELEEIRSGAEKSLLMGFILTNLLQAVRHCHANQSDFQHITLIEEAHRLLSRYMPGDSMNKKHGVEVFSDMLAEVRKYGESLIIVDQIPDKMTPEVLKNTNTKIVHKLFAQDDKDAIGNTMALDDDQKAFLSNLAPGRAIMFSQGWTKAIQLQVTELNETDREDIKPDIIRQAAINYYAQATNVQRGVLQGLERLPNVDGNKIEMYLSLMQSGDEWLSIYQQYVKAGSAGLEALPKDRERFGRFSEGIRHAVEKYGVDMVVAYLASASYEDIDEGREAVLKEVLKKIFNDKDVKMSIITRHNADLFTGKKKGGY